MTNVNAYLAEAEEAVAAAKAAVNDAEQKLEALRNRVNEDQAGIETPPEPAEQPPKEPGVSGAASEGEADSKTKSVKYK